ncbi:MAG TPA: DUF1801 domain-containing protein [Acidimicrobiales bacterium]|nr:DUF1801 domain-containing protein [Acidimicrobiales bacterium]
MMTKTTNPVEAYLEELDEPKRSTLRQLRSSILEVIPEAEECISYGLPAFRVGGKVIAGFAAFKNHLSYLPHSGSVFPELGPKVAGYETTTGSLHFPVDKPLPKVLVRQLVRVRMSQAFPPERRPGRTPPVRGRSRGR